MRPLSSGSGLQVSAAGTRHLWTRADGLHPLQLKDTGARTTETHLERTYGTRLGAPVKRNLSLFTTFIFDTSTSNRWNSPLENGRY